ncbi:MAG: hypothetical protein WD733_13480 [Bryobacterales bacterium]
MKFARPTSRETKPAPNLNNPSLSRGAFLCCTAISGLLLAGCATEAPAPGDATAGGAVTTEQVAAFIPQDFEPPVSAEGDGFILKPLGPDVMQADYDAYMSSIEHLQKTFTRTDKWPREGLTIDDAAEDMANEKRRFDARESFAYAVLTVDGSRERGCVYVRPAGKPGYDAAVQLWVTKAEFDDGFDELLYSWTIEWIDSEWPFETVAYPGRNISWAEWEALPDQAD